jgi:regulator of protease activity HflC (stomatin/prohibitin superfamily)
MENLTKPDIARLEKKAAITKAEGAKEAIILNGEAVAIARKKLFDAIGRKPENIQKEILLRLSEMAQGPATTIFPIPSKIFDVFEGAFGKKVTGLDLEGFLKTDLGKKIIQSIVDELKRR